MLSDLEQKNNHTGSVLIRVKVGQCTEMVGTTHVLIWYTASSSAQRANVHITANSTPQPVAPPIQYKNLSELKSVATFIWGLGVDSLTNEAEMADV